MLGLKFDFEQNDITIGADGSFVTAQTDQQNIALIALSQVCQLTNPRLGAQIGSKLINRPASSASSLLGAAQRMAEDDGATDVAITLTSDGKLYFNGKYESDN